MRDASVSARFRLVCLRIPSSISRDNEKVGKGEQEEKGNAFLKGNEGAN